MFHGDWSQHFYIFFFPFFTIWGKRKTTISQDTHKSGEAPPEKPSACSIIIERIGETFLRFGEPKILQPFSPWQQPFYGEPFVVFESWLHWHETPPRLLKKVYQAFCITAAIHTLLCKHRFIFGLWSRRRFCNPLSMTLQNTHLQSIWCFRWDVQELR